MRRRLEQHAVLGAHRIALRGVDEERARSAPASPRCAASPRSGTTRRRGRAARRCSTRSIRCGPPRGLGPCSARCSASDSGRSRVHAGEQPRQAHRGPPAFPARAPLTVSPVQRELDAEAHRAAVRRSDQRADDGVVEDLDPAAVARWVARRGRASPRCGPCAGRRRAAAARRDGSAARRAGRPSSRMRRSATAVPSSAVQEGESLSSC